MNNEFDVNDPRLTAFVLGELNGEEAIEIEKRLESDLSLRIAVDEIRAAAGLVERELKAEASPGLTEIQRERLMQESESAPRELPAGSLRFNSLRLWIWGGSLAAAACVAIMILPQFGKARNQASIVALHDGVAGERDNSESLFYLRDRAASSAANVQQPAPPSLGKSVGSYGQVPRTESSPPPMPSGPSGGVTLHSAIPNFDNAPGLDLDAALREGDAPSGVPVGKTPAEPSTAGAGVSQPDHSAAIRNNYYFPEIATTPAPAGSPGSRDIASGGFGGGGGGGGRGLSDPGSSGEQYGAARSAGPDASRTLVVPGPLTPQEIQAMSKDEAKAAVFRVAHAESFVRDPVARERLKNERRWLIQKLKATPGTEAYNLITDNPFLKSTDEPLSTFSIDVDTASYSNVRRFVTSGSLPPKDAVRIEELINYFNYDYEPPSDETGAPFSANVEINAAPWNPQHRLVRIGLRGKDVPPDMRPATSLVFLIDVSGSMQPANKLPLVREGLKLLVEKLNGDDRLAIVTYAGNAGLVMDSVYVNAENKPRILAAIDGLGAGGSTNGAGGLLMAYDVATNYFIKGGVNRVILCTDGDFNVGVSGDNELVRLIENKRTTGVFLSVLGFGTGNLKDGKMEQLANHGNGTFAYIDNIEEAKRTLVDRLSGTLVTNAKDVKIQIEFNPAKVAAYRLIGYENRVLAAQDFNDDRKDAGEIGAGHTVTALYEVVPPGIAIDPANPEPPPVDELKYQKPAGAADAKAQAEAGQFVIDLTRDELMTLKLRYKLPDAADSTKIEIPVRDGGATSQMATPDFQFAAAVAGFGMILRESPYKGQANLGLVLDLAGASVGQDADGKRAEFMSLVQQAGALMPVPAANPEPCLLKE